MAQPEAHTMTLQIPLLKDGTLQKKSFTIDCFAELMVNQLQPSQCIMTSQTLFEGTDAYHGLQIMDKKDLLKVMVADPPNYNRCGVHLDAKGNGEDRLATQCVHFEKFEDKAGYTDVTIYGVSNEEFVKILSEQKPSLRQIQVFSDEQMESVGWDMSEALQLEDKKMWEWMNENLTTEEWRRGATKCCNDNADEFPSVFIDELFSRYPGEYEKFRVRAQQ
jgi:hypothetical protein